MTRNRLNTPQSDSADKTLLAYAALAAGIFSLSFSAMFVRWANAPGPVTAFYRLFFSILLLLPFFLSRLKINRSINSRSIVFPLLAGLFTAIVSQLIGCVLLAYALGHLPASIVSPTMILQPIITTPLAIPSLGDIPSIWQGIGGAIALIGILVVNESHNRNQAEFATPNA
jgi:drug/metabolite transporter (DMT)-like permease